MEGGGETSPRVFGPPRKWVDAILMYFQGLIEHLHITDHPHGTH